MSEETKERSIHVSSLSYLENIGPAFKPPSLFNPRNGQSASFDPFGKRIDADLQMRVDKLVRSYRVRGHLHADLDPLERPRPRIAELDPATYRISKKDYGRPLSPETLFGSGPLTVRRVLDRLKKTYARHIGVQYMHIDDYEVKEWLMERMERSQNHLEVPASTQKRILSKLTDAVVFEEFLQKRFVGAKSFSLEGAETLIPLLDQAIGKSADQGVEEVVIAMAHRGRLNVLTNIMGKKPRQIFREFEDNRPETYRGKGDVKYHLGFSNDYETPHGKTVHLSLCFNPSHLEFVNPVALGRVRAKQDRFGDEERRRCLGLLIHGDAGFAGEGVVQETLNFSQVHGFKTGGTLHVIVNNQIGFTTPPEEARSNTYASAVAKSLQIPIFHVNGENPEAVAQAVDLALDFRVEFKRDAVIDMFCYRLHGHNEADEPSFTQPLMYRAIEKKKSIRDSFLEHLLKLGEMTEEESERIAEESKARLESEFAVARDGEDLHPVHELPEGIWEGYRGGKEGDTSKVETGVESDQLKKLLESQTRFPEGFHPHPKIEKAMKRRMQMISGENPLDWSAAEALAFASIAKEGYRIRLSGQDSARGTFGQRHATLHDTDNGRTYVPLQNLSQDQAPVEILNSPLSEAGILGFEYGYSLDCPDGLVLWEAQFGDFINAAQVIVDQFIASAEDKWNRLSGIVLLLPHGFEGMGPEHSSAHLERFLLLSAESNIQVVYPTTPAQYFHLLRRQILRIWRKPLIVMTPKSLLRHPRCVSRWEHLEMGSFHPVLHDTRENPQTTERILLCSGKIYYELEKHREKLEREEVAIVRVEQLYPVRQESYIEALSPYEDGTPVFWVQEEPKNMGAWRFMKGRFGERILGRFPFSGFMREESASPATGSAASHEIEQTRLIERAFGNPDRDEDPS